MKRICFMGTASFALPALKALIDSGKYKPVVLVTQADKKVGRKQILEMPEPKKMALAADIPCLQFTSCKSAESVATLRTYDIDLIVTAAYGQILPEDMLNIPKCGAINLHGSLLPKYRGASPIQTAILNGDAYSGVTIMKMVKAMDAGCIYQQYSLPIGQNMTYTDLETALANLVAQHLVSFLDSYFAGEIVGKEQAEDEVTFCHMLKREDGLIDWTKTALEIHNQVRAFYPWPNAYSTYNDKILKIYKSNLVSMSDLDAHWQKLITQNQQALFAKHESLNGAVLGNKGRLLIGTKQNFLEICELQFAGGKRLNAKDVAHNFQIGTYLGTTKPQAQANC